MPCTGALDETSGSLPGTTEFCGPLAHPHHAPSLSFEPKHIDFVLRIDLDKHSVKGSATHVAESRKDGATTIELHAEDFIDVSARKFESTYDGHMITITVPPTAKGDTIRVTVDFEVCDPVTGLAFARAGEGEWAVSDHETERARYWLPLIDHPSVRTTINFRLTTRAHLTALANGVRFGEFKDEADGWRTVEWRMDQRTPSYLICMAIGDFICVRDGEHNGKEVSYFAARNTRLRHTEARIRQLFGRTHKMIDFMEKRTGIPLPWGKYYQFVAGKVGGAMENSSLVSYDDIYLYDAPDAPLRGPPGDSTIVHELAHTWFGNAVVCADFAHNFLKESFATLISMEWAHEHDGHDEFHYSLWEARNYYEAEASRYCRPVAYRTYENSKQLYDRTLYHGGAFRLHMLRQRLGHDVFWSGVSEYLKSNWWKTVETDDLRRSLEKASGESLTEFFDQWFYGIGYPFLEVSFKYENGFATISANQTQAKKKMPAKKEVFSISLEVALETENGQWESHHLKMADGNLTGRAVVALKSRPLQVVVDPQLSALAKMTKLTGIGDDQLIRSLSHAPTYAGRCFAAHQLRKGSSKKGRLALENALSTEKSARLRGAIANLIGQIRMKSGLKVLIAALENEKDQRTVLKIVTAIGQFKNDESVAALRDFLSKRTKETPSLVVAEAVTCLGKAREPEDMPLFLGLLDGSGGLHANAERVQMSAANAIGHSRSLEGADALLDALKDDGTRLSWRVQCAAARWMSTCIECMQTREKIMLYEQLMKRYDEVKDTCMWRLRLAMAQTLASFADVRYDGNTFDTLEREAIAQAKPGARRVGQHARSTRCGASSAAAAEAEKRRIRKEVGEMRDKIGLLEAKIEAIVKVQDKSVKVQDKSVKVQDKSVKVQDKSAKVQDKSVKVQDKADKVKPMSITAMSNDTANSHSAE